MPDASQATHVNPPKQPRSQRTLERIVDASLELLATEGPEGLTVHAVVERANSSVGSFYARFGGKEDLLDYLGERIWQEALQRWNEALDARDWSELRLEGLIEGAVGLLIDAQRSRSAYLRALDRAAGRATDAYAAFRAQLLVGLGELLASRRGEITHHHPDLAIRLGLHAVLGVLDAENRRLEDRLDRDTLVAECSSLLLAYLTGRRASAPADGVDFFDVWG